MQHTQTAKLTLWSLVLHLSPSNGRLLHIHEVATARARLSGWENECHCVEKNNNTAHQSFDECSRWDTTVLCHTSQHTNRTWSTLGMCSDAFKMHLSENESDVGSVDNLLQSECKMTANISQVVSSSSPPVLADNACAVGDSAACCEA